MEKGIFLIVFDTLRQDYSEGLRKLLLKEEFYFYPRAISTSPWTLPSHASMFTGLYPSYHGAHESKTGKISPIRTRSLLVTKYLKDLGYTNILLTSNLLISPDLGFDFFDEVHEIPHIRNLLRLDYKDRETIERMKSLGSKKYLYYKYPKLAVKIASRYILKKTGLYSMLDKLYKILTRQYVNKGNTLLLNRLSRILERYKGKKLFVFINFMEMHEPYSVYEILHPDVVLKTLLEKGKADYIIVNKWRRGYLRQSKYIVSVVRKLFDILYEKGYGNSAIIITSDHGQLLGEYNGLINHIAFLYDELIRVPFFIKVPNNYTFIESKDANMWLSGIMIKNIILDLARKERIDFNYYLRKTVYSESFGIHSMDLHTCSDRYSCKFLKHNKRRIAVFKANSKLVYVPEDRNVEEFKHYGEVKYKKKYLIDLAIKFDKRVKNIMGLSRIRENR